MSAAPALPRPVEGWTPFQHFFIEDLYRKLHARGLEYSICLNIWRLTTGGKVGRDGKRPQWARITQGDFALWGYSTTDGVLKAIKSLQTNYKNCAGEALPLIEIRKVGRQNEYRVLVENCKQLPEPPAKVRTDRKVVEMPKFLKARGFRPVPIENLCGDCLPLFVPEEKAKDQKIVISITSETDTQSTTQVLTKKPVGKEEAENSRTKGETCSESVQKSVADQPQVAEAEMRGKRGKGGTEGESIVNLRFHSQVYDYLVRVVTPRLASSPPSKISQEIAHLLSNVPFQLFERRVELRLKKVTDWGMLVGLARDVRSAHRQMEEQRLAIEKRQQDWTDRYAAEQRKEALRCLANLIERGDDDNAVFLAGDDEQLLAEARELAGKRSTGSK